MRQTTTLTGRRGVSSAVSYSIIIVLTLALTGGLIVGTDALVSSQRDRAVSDQLDVVGEQLASTIQTVDRMAATTSSRAEVTREFPQRAAGTQYRVILTDTGPPGGQYQITVETSDGDVTTRTAVSVDTPLDLGGTEERLNGGALRVRYDDGPDNLVVEDAS